MIIQDILRDGNSQEEVEGLDRWDMLPQPQKIMIGFVILTPIDRGEEGILGRLDPTLINRLELHETVGPHAGVVNVFIGERYVLQDGKKLRLSREALDEVTHCVKSHQGMEWTAVMAWREI
jgi:hypothetical protein